MTMNPTGRTMSDEDQKLIQEYLDKGGEVSVKAYGERSEEIGYTGGFYQRRKKQKEETQQNDD